MLRLSVRSRGKKNWCGGGKHATEPEVGFRDQGAVPDGQVAIGGVRQAGRSRWSFPSVSTQANRSCSPMARAQAGVVEDRPPILLRVNDRLDVHQARASDKPSAAARPRTARS